MNSFSSPGQFNLSNIQGMNQQQRDDMLFTLAANFYAMQDAQQQQQQASLYDKEGWLGPNVAAKLRKEQEALPWTSQEQWYSDWKKEEKKPKWGESPDEYQQRMMGYNVTKEEAIQGAQGAQWGERAKAPEFAVSGGDKDIATPEYLSLANDFENLSKALSQRQFAGHPAVKDVINIAPIKSLRELAKRIGNPMGGGTYPLGSYSQLQKDIQDFRQKMRVHLYKHFKIPMNQTEGWGYPDLAKQILDAYSPLLKGGQ